MKIILIAVLLAGFAGSRASAADFGSLNVSADQLKAAAAANTAVIIPNMPKPPTKATPPATDITGDISDLIPGAASHNPASGTTSNTDINGDVSELIHGAALHNPTLRGLHFLALTGREVLEAPYNNNLPQLENMRASALCKFLGYGKALLTMVASAPEEKMTMLNIEPAGMLTQNVYEAKINIYDMDHSKKCAPAFLAEVICAPKGK